MQKTMEDQAAGELVERQMREAKATADLEAKNITANKAKADLQLAEENHQKQTQANAA